MSLTTTNLTSHYWLNDDLQVERFFNLNLKPDHTLNEALKEALHPILASHKERYEFVRGNLVNTLYL